MSGDAPTSSPPPGAKPLWGSYGAGAAPASSPQPAGPQRSRFEPKGFGGEPLDPLSRKLMYGVRFLALLMVLVGVNSFVNPSEETLEFNPVAAAAERTQSYPGAKFTLQATYTSSGLPQPMYARGSGAYNSETGRSRAAIATTSAPANISIESIADQTSIYMRGSGAAAEELPDGKEWVKFDPFLGQSSEDLMVGAGGSPDETLQMLRAISGDVQQVGQEQVRGVLTTRYRATLTMSGFADAMREEGNEEMAELYEKYAALSPSPFLIEAWVDAKDTVRRSRMVMDIPIGEGKPALTMDMRMEFFDFGARPEIALPDPSSVFDATPYLEEELDEVD